MTCFDRRCMLRSLSKCQETQLQRNSEVIHVLYIFSFEDGSSP